MFVRNQNQKTFKYVNPSNADSHKSSPLPDKQGDSDLNSKYININSNHHRAEVFSFNASSKELSVSSNTKKAVLTSPGQPYSYYVDHRGLFHLKSGLIIYEKATEEEIKLAHLRSQVKEVEERLIFCGHHKRVFSCPNCGKEVKTKYNLSCEMRYCNRPNCLSTKWSNAMLTLNKTFLEAIGGELDREKIKTSFNLLTLLQLNLFSFSIIEEIAKKRLVLHFSISFKTKQFEGYDKAEQIKRSKKQAQRIIRNFFSKLRKGNPVKPGHRKRKENYDPIPIKAVKILDFKNCKKGRNKGLLIHHHFAVTNKIPIDFKAMQKVRKEMLDQAKNKWAWHLQFHLNKKRRDGRKPAHSVFSYFAKRLAGIYGKSDRYNNPGVKKLKDIVKDKRIYFMNSFLSVEEYVTSLYNAKFLSGIGINISLYTCNERDIATDEKMLTCPYCGFVGLFKRRIEVFRPPGPLSIFKVLIIKVERLASASFCLVRIITEMCERLYNNPLTFYEKEENVKWK